MEENIKKELEELQKLPEAERDENQQNRFKELNSWAEAEKTAEQKSKDLQSALAQKDHFRTKAEEAEAKKVELEQKLTGAGQVTSMPVDPLEVVKLGKALSDFNEDETSFIIKNAKDKTPQGIVEASKDEWVADAIKARREKVAKEKQILGPSNSGSGGSPHFTAKSPQEIAKMSKEDYDKYLEQLQKQKPKGVIFETEET